LQKQQVAGKKIQIVRGVGGRELLHERLKSNTAKVGYWQLYQRVVMDSGQQSWYDLWQKQQIDCIIVTSVAIFNAIVDTLPESAVPWLHSVHWVVASDRIGDNARKFGICSGQITNAQGATDEKLIAAVKQITET
jgi:uroporphyrinogen-III synthase